MIIELPAGLWVKGGSGLQPFGTRGFKGNPCHDPHQLLHRLFTGILGHPAVRRRRAQLGTAGEVSVGPDTFPGRWRCGQELPTTSRGVPKDTQGT